MILQDYSKPCRSSEKRQWKRPMRKMFPQHICVCDNNVLNLSGRRSISPDGKHAMSVRESSPAPIHSAVAGSRTQARSKSVSYTATGKTHDFVTASEPTAKAAQEKRLDGRREGYKQQVRQILLKKFQKIYEEQSPPRRTPSICTACTNRGMAQKRAETAHRQREADLAQERLENEGREAAAEEEDLDSALKRQRVREMLQEEMRRVQTQRQGKGQGQRQRNRDGGARTGWVYETVDYARINALRKEEQRERLRESVRQQLWAQEYRTGLRNDSLGLRQAATAFEWGSPDTSTRREIDSQSASVRKTAYTSHAVTHAESVVAAGGSPDSRFHTEGKRRGNGAIQERTELDRRREDRLVIKRRAYS